MFYARRGIVWKEASKCLGKAGSRLSQMLYNRLYLRLQEGAPFGIVVHGMELLHEQRTTLHPAVKGLLGGLGSTAWLVEQSQFGLAIGTDLKHVFGDFMVFDYYTNIRNIHHQTK
jgi:hypothetical protein